MCVCVGGGGREKKRGKVMFFFFFLPGEEKRERERERERERDTHPPQHRVLDQEAVGPGQLVERPRRVLGPDVDRVDRELVAEARAEACLERLGRGPVTPARVRHQDHHALLRPSRGGPEEGAERGAEGGREGEGVGGAGAGELVRVGRRGRVFFFLKLRRGAKKRGRERKPPRDRWNLLLLFFLLSVALSLPLSLSRSLSLSLNSLSAYVRHEAREQDPTGLTQSEAPTLPAKAFRPRLADDNRAAL